MIKVLKFLRTVFPKWVVDKPSLTLHLVYMIKLLRKALFIDIT